MKQTDTVILVFLKPFEAGYVKTRLAATIGNNQALKVYRHLVEHTILQLHQMSHTTDVVLCYSRQPASNELSNADFPHMLQKGEDLGSRMLHALEWAHDRKYKKKIIIGTDCYDLTSEILEQAIRALQTKEVVLGPAEDGGYFLIGMKMPHPDLFTDIPWSTSGVLSATEEVLVRMQPDWLALPTLTDIDQEQDLLRYPELCQLVNL